MNPTNPTQEPRSTTPPRKPSLARRLALLAMPLLVALGLFAPQLRAAPLYLDFATNLPGGVTTATGWTPFYQSNSAGLANVGGSGYTFSFPGVGAFQGTDAAQTLTRSGFHTNGSTSGITNARTFTLSGLNPNKPVKLYACAAWDVGRGAYIVYGDTGAGGVKAVTVGNPGTTGSLANLTLIGTATANGSGVVTGTMHGRNSVPGTEEGQLGAIAFIPTQIITASTGANGTITPLGATDAYAGTSPVYTVTPDSGYHVADVLVDGVSVGAVSSYTFTNVAANHTISATFAIDTTSYTITASAGANGTIDPVGATSAFEGTNKPFTITPDLGYHIADVLVDGVSVGAVSNYTFTNVTANHTIAASFAINTYTITATAGTGGSISPSGTTTVNYGGDQTYEITPDAGYYISSVLIDGVAVPPDDLQDFSGVTANHTIAVTFDNRERVYLDFGTPGSASSVTNGWIPVTASLQADTMVSIADVGGLGYGFTFGHVASYDNGNAAQPLTRAGFYNSGGTGFSHPFALTGLTPGQTVSLYACAAWDGNGAGAYIVYGDSGSTGVKAQTVGTPGLMPTLANLTLIGTSIVDVNGTVSGATYGPGGLTSAGEGQIGGFVFAIEAPPVFTITASAGPNGTISPSGAVGVVAGDNQSFTITPNSGYHIADVLVDGISIGVESSYTFNVVTANHTISATFAVDTVTHTINASAGANGSITPSGAVVVNAGVNKVFTITPSTGHHIADVLVDGASVGPVASYTFTNVSANHTIAASFAINTYIITSTAGTGGSISPSGSIDVNSGDSPTFTLTPDAGYYVDNVIVDGVSVGPVTSYTFTNVTADHSISATFDNRVKLKLDFTVTGTPVTSGWTPVNGNYVADTALASVSNIDSLGYNFSVAHVGAYDNNNATQSLTRSGLYTFGNNTNDHTFTLTGLNAGQSVTLYACAAWDGNARAGVVLYGNNAPAGVKALTVGTPGTSPTLANLTEIGTAISDANGTITGSLHGADGVNTNIEGQFGGFIFAISAGGTPPVGTPFSNWATSPPYNLTGNNALPESDPDFDGVPNIIEFALNSDPTSGGSTGKSFAQMATVSTVPNVLTYTIATLDGASFSADGNRQKATVSGVTYTIEASDGLANWGGPVVTEVTGGDAAAIQEGLPEPDDGWTYKTFRTDGDSATDSTEFIRAGIE
ncbi:MAG: hypothetical protein V4689_04750 [Verrucomicrobiota bacterium]